MPYSCRFRRFADFAVCTVALLCGATFAFGQAAPCGAKRSAPPSPAATALAEGKLPEAESLFAQAMAQNPQDANAIAGLARTRLRLGKQEQAAKDVEAAIASFPTSAALEVALADVQLSEGEPWLASESLKRATELDPCSAQAWLVRSKMDRLDSMHAAERDDITKAHTLDPADPEVTRAWNRTVLPANDAVNSAEYLRTTKDVDPELRKAAEESMWTTAHMLAENTQSCKGLPEETAATLPLTPSMQDPKHVDGYQLKVSFGKAAVSLGVDTTASGFYISRTVAEANGLVSKAGDPPGTLHADTVQVGTLTFHDCVVGVSDTAFPNKAAGFIGTDLFAQYLTEMNFLQGKLLLKPLPKVDAVVPGDRPQSPDLAGFSPAVHRLQYMMVPVTLNNKERRLFVLDSGLRLTAIKLPLAHLVSRSRHGFTNSIKTVAGGTIQIYNDNFDLDFAHQQLRGRSGLLEFNPTFIEETSGLRVGGLIGLDILQSAVLSLDYRDGLVKVDFPVGETAPPEKLMLAKAGGGSAQQDACNHTLPKEVPRAATIMASNTGMWDVHQLKLGQTVALKLERSYEIDSCHLEKGGLLHGRVVSVSVGHDPDPSRLGFAFDRAECFGKAEIQMPMRLVSVMGSDDGSSNVSHSMPSSILNGRGQQISDTIDTVQNPGEFDNVKDAKLRTITTGTVQGLPSITLDTAGPGCSGVLTGVGSSLRLGAGTRWFLVSTR